MIKAEQMKFPICYTIENGIKDILEDYYFEFNTPITRLEIKTRVETYLDTFRSNGSIYDFLVIIDEHNNTQEVLDNHMGIIDIILEPEKGVKLTNRVSLFKTINIDSYGFRRPIFLDPIKNINNINPNVPIEFTWKMVSGEIIVYHLTDIREFHECKQSNKLTLKDNEVYYQSVIGGVFINADNMEILPYNLIPCTRFYDE